jgi:hypothetical protein
LAETVAALIRIGAAAIAERVERGDDWMLWADWACANCVTALTASRADVRRWAEDADLPASDLNAVLSAIQAVHRSAGWQQTFTELA